MIRNWFQRRVADHADQDMSSPPLDERIEYMISKSIPFDPENLKIPVIRDAIKAIALAGYAIRVDNFYDQKVSESIGRLGSAVFSEKHSPLIYLILGLNADEIELADTIFHEALHCTAKTLGRHVVLPEEENSGESLLEELCVYSGLNHLYPLLRVPQMRVVHRRNQKRHDMLKSTLATGISIEYVNQWDRYGIEAAEHLHNLIKMKNGHPV